MHWRFNTAAELTATQQQVLNHFLSLISCIRLIHVQHITLDSSDSVPGLSAGMAWQYFSWLANTVLCRLAQMNT